MPNEQQKDLVQEARDWCESSDAMLNEPMRQLLTGLCDEVERRKYEETKNFADAMFRED